MCGADLDLQAVLLRPGRAIGRGQHLHSLAVPDDAAEDAAEGQEHLLRRVLGTRLTCMCSSGLASGNYDLLTACTSSTVYGIAGAGLSEQSMSSDNFSLPGTLGRAEAGTATILDT